MPCEACALCGGRTPPRQPLSRTPTGDLLRRAFSLTAHLLELRRQRERCLQEVLPVFECWRTDQLDAFVEALTKPVVA